MNFFKVKTADELSSLHDLAFPNTSQATKTTFYQSMRRIERIYDMPMPEIKLSFINDTDSFMNKLDKSRYSANTKLTTITNVLKLLKIIDAPLVDYNKWLQLLKEKTNERQESETAILKSKLQVLSDFKDIKMIVYDKAGTYINSDDMIMEDYRDFLILALFTIQIPVRVSNYVNMKVVDDEIFTNEKDNFLVVDDENYKFIFNRYRTSHLLGKKEMYVTEKTLQYLIDKWLATYNKDSQNFLIQSDKNRRPMNGRQIEDSIKMVTTKLFGTQMTIDNIRASYMKRIADLDPDFQNKLDIANILGFANPEIIDKHKGTNLDKQS